MRRGCKRWVLPLYFNCAWMGLGYAILHSALVLTLWAAGAPVFYAWSRRAERESPCPDSVARTDAVRVATFGYPWVSHLVEALGWPALIVAYAVDAIAVRRAWTWYIGDPGAPE